MIDLPTARKGTTVAVAYQIGRKIDEDVEGAIRLLAAERGLEIDVVMWTSDEVEAGDSRTKGIAPRGGPIVTLAWDLRRILVMTHGFLKTHHEVVLLGRRVGAEEAPKGVAVKAWLAERLDAAEVCRLNALVGSKDTFVAAVLTAKGEDVDLARETLLALGGKDHSTAEIASAWRSSIRTRALGDGLMGIIAGHSVGNQP
jgi:hypothetical protein